MEEAKVKRIAYGVVINENPYENYPNWIYYKTKTPLPMYHNGKVYGAFFQFTDFKFKGYDKTFEVWKHGGKRIAENYFRIETETNNMRHLRNRKEPININTPKDIFNFEILQQLGDDLLTKYRTIEKRPVMNFKKLTTHQLGIISSMQLEPIREHLRKHRPKTYKRYKKQFRELTGGANAEYYNGVEEKIKLKLSELINN